MGGSESHMGPTSGSGGGGNDGRSEVYFSPNVIRRLNAIANSRAAFAAASSKQRRHEDATHSFHDSDSKAEVGAGEGGGGGGGGGGAIRTPDTGSTFPSYENSLVRKGYTFEESEGTALLNSTAAAVEMRTESIGAVGGAEGDIVPMTHNSPVSSTNMRMIEADDGDVVDIDILKHSKQDITQFYMDVLEEKLESEASELSRDLDMFLERAEKVEKDLSLSPTKRQGAITKTNAEFSAKIAACYKENSNQVLKCEDIVRAFAAAVNQQPNQN